MSWNEYLDKGWTSSFKQRIFEPLGMEDTGFHVTTEKSERFSSTYGPGQNGRGLKIVDSAESSKYLQPPTLYSGGGGLVSTAPDFMGCA